MNGRALRKWQAAVALSVSLAVQAQTPTWILQFGSFSDDYPQALARCESGGVLVAGNSEQVWLPGGVGSYDPFLIKFDDSGNFLWGLQFGTVASDTVYAVAADGSDGSFVAGWTSGSIGAPFAGGERDAWFARHNAAGARLWARQLGTAQYDEATGVAADGHGGVFVAGHTTGVLAVPAPGGQGDGWLSRYDEKGNQLWIRQFGSSSSDTLSFAAADAVGGVFVAGDTAGSFGGPYAGGPADGWVARFHDSGTMLWARQVGCAQDDAVFALSGDGFGGLFVAGGTTGGLAAPNAGIWDIWIARYDASGNQLAISQFGSAATDSARAVAPDGFGGAFVGGTTLGGLAGPFAGIQDVWIARIQSASSITWIRQFGTPVFDTTSAMTPAGPGSVFVAGWTDGNIITGGSGNVSDAWLARYDLCYPDCNGDGALTVTDFGCFQTRFITADMYSDCNADGVLTVQDFGCFQTKFVAGCP